MKKKGEKHRNTVLTYPVAMASFKHQTSNFNPQPPAPLTLHVACALFCSLSFLLLYKR